MHLYHGSTESNIQKLEPRNATISDDPSIPEYENRKGIYLTNDYAMALAMAVRPKGETRIDTVHRTIEFENPETFNPDQRIYIYKIDSAKIPQDNLEAFPDGWQFIVTDMNIEVPPPEAQVASEITKYFKLTNHPKDEKVSEFKISVR